MCEMIKAHHPDCGCGYCEAGQDERCQNPDVGVTVDGDILVCAACARALEREGFKIKYKRPSNAAQ